jgi:hypothetical protein
MNMQ